MIQKEWGFGGEDAYFVKKIARKTKADSLEDEWLRDSDGMSAGIEGETDYLIGLGVADGVYLWRLEGGATSQCSPGALSMPSSTNSDLAGFICIDLRSSNLVYWFE